MFSFVQVVVMRATELKATGLSNMSVKTFGLLPKGRTVTFPGQREMESDSGLHSLKNCTAFAAANPAQM